MFLFIYLQKYNKESRIEGKNGQVLVANISSVIKTMMDKKQQALKVNTAHMYFINKFKSYLQ